jgi:nucleotide-binding universal stress UspA family protein
MNERILVAVDDSIASERAIEYVGRVLGDVTGSSFVLFHVLPPHHDSDATAGVAGTLGPLAPDGGDLPAKDDLYHYAEKMARPVLERMTRILTASGVDGSRIDDLWFVAGRGDSIDHDILEQADENGCATIVVGRHALPWYREMFHAHVGDKLVKHAEGHTVWVVEGGERAR